MLSCIAVGKKKHISAALDVLDLLQDFLLRKHRKWQATFLADSLNDILKNLSWHLFTHSLEILAPSYDRICACISILCLLLLLSVSASSYGAPGGAGWRRKEEAGWVIAGNGDLSSCLNTVRSVPELRRRISSCCCGFCLKWHTGGSGSCSGPQLWLCTIPTDVPQAVRWFLILNFKNKWLHLGR